MTPEQHINKADRLLRGHPSMYEGYNEPNSPPSKHEVAQATAHALTALAMLNLPVTLPVRSRAD